MNCKNAEHYGYVVGDKFRYRDDVEDCNKNESLMGNVLTLIKDDGTDCPRFATENGIEGYEDLQFLRKVDADETKQIKPQDLGCWQQVVDALGEERAAIELQKVIDTPKAQTGLGTTTVSTTFIWAYTPQGIEFWRAIAKGHYPDNTPQNEEFEMAVEVDNKAMVEPVFGIVVRQCDIPEGCNVHVGRDEVTISFDRKYYPVKTEEGYAVVMQAIRLLAEAKNIEK